LTTLESHFINKLRVYAIKGRGDLGMKKTTHCPFTHKSCMECAPYRGRHYYLNFSKQDEGHCASGPKSRIFFDFQALEKCLEPWADKDDQRRSEPNIRLKVIDIDAGEPRICEFDEAKTWDWSDPLTLRLIDGRHVNSLDRLIEILNYKMDRGYEEVEIYEVPRFILFSGG
jgi:hypothetical protein